MTDRDKVKLLGGPNRPPAVRPGQRAICLCRGEVRGCGTSSAPRKKFLAPRPPKVVKVDRASVRLTVGQKIAFGELAALVAGTESVYTVSAEAMKAREVRLRVELSADQLPAGPIKAEESTTLYSDAPR